MENKFNNLNIDFYEFTMGQGYVDKKIDENIVYFDYFFRKVPDKGGFAIASGIEPLMQYLENFKFEKSDIDYLRTLGKFSDEYLEKLSNIKFSGDVWAVKDGTPVFPNEPIITIKAPLLQAQLIETALLVIQNHANLITTKTNRIVRAGKGRSVMEFGSRRAQGETGAIDGAYYAYLGGAIGTACTATGKKYGIPVLGTMAHSFVQAFDTEYEAFQAYAKTFPDNTVLLVDTFDTINSGIPNAIKTHFEVLKPMGKELKGIRIDSGDLPTLTKTVRKMLNDAGLKNVQIVVSNSLDEIKIDRMLDEGAEIDSFGVGENLITAKSQPVFGGVYKLVAIEKHGQIVPKIKLSEDVVKTTNPDFKNIYRIYDKDGTIFADVLTRHNEKLNRNKILGYKIELLREKVMENGKRLQKPLTPNEIRENVLNNIKKIKPNLLNLQPVEAREVLLSSRLSKLKDELIKEHKGQVFENNINKQPIICDNKNNVDKDKNILLVNKDIKKSTLIEGNERARI